MVHHDCCSLSSLVSPQQPIMLESSAHIAIKRFRESGVTVCKRENIQKPILFLKMNATYRIGIDREDVLIEGRVDTDDVPHLMINFQLQWCHGRIEMDAVEVMH